MSNDDRQRRLGRRDPRGRVRAGSVPLPNVLADAATPNRLSSESAPNAGGLSGTQAGVTIAPAGVASGRQRLRLPGVTTLVFIGFVALTAFRFVGQLVEDAATETPGASSAVVVPGPIAFGTSLDEDCGVIGAGVEFDWGTDVWWAATLSTLQKPDAAPVVLTFREGKQFAREDVLADESIGDWDILCSGGPVGQRMRGQYRVEVWNEDSTVLLAAGEYVLS